MDITYRIKNFRNFGKQGAEFDFSPITILTGANSAGKSSLVKSLMVLKTYLANNHISKTGGDVPFRAKPAANIPLQFSDGELKLGRFDSAVNSDCEGGDTMTFEYDIESTTLGCPVSVSLEFSADASDPMNNGWINSVKITNPDGEVVYHAVADGGRFKIHTFMLSWFKERFIKACIFTGMVRSLEQYSMPGIISTAEIGQLVDFYKKQVADRLSPAEKDLFLKWHNNNNTDIFRFGEVYLVDTNIIDELKAYAEYNILNARSKLVGDLCRLSKDEAISRIEGIRLDSLPGTKYFEHIKACMLDALRQSDVDNFLDWYYAEENRFLDSWAAKVDALSDVYIFARYCAEKYYTSETNTTVADRDVVDRFLDFVEFLSWADDEIREKIQSDGMRNSVILSEQEKTYSTFNNYLANAVLPELLVPDFAKNLNYIGSAQVVVQRLYSNQAGNNRFSDLLFKYFKAKRNYFNAKRNHTEEYEPDSFMNKWINAFGIGKSLTLKNAEGGIGLLAVLHKTEGDKGRLLADEGYGVTQLLSIILNIELAILTADTRESCLDENLCLTTSSYAYLPQTLAIEEPENHLHPKLQSLLADMFLDAYTNYNIHFIIETHSEYLIRKTQVLVDNEKYSSNEEADKKTPFRTFYLPDNGAPYSLGYRKDGKFVNEFGKGFYDEAANLMFRIL